ncbi:unnamed protein product [Phyllotreta striolata]|uniref:Uncharacterized protein n=1 Tax=Phyllotreta striolata TaxID=444603 RepID=A0A9N9XNF8_PHYSR|nr:unnamed protein product [Phyllotreta striolata]
MESIKSTNRRPAEHFCPRCPGVILPACSMEEHFRQHHRSWILDHPEFHVRMNSTSEIYLYKEQDCLFFIKCDLDVESRDFKLSSFNLGDGNVQLVFETFLLEEPIDCLQILQKDNDGLDIDWIIAKVKIRCGDNFEYFRDLCANVNVKWPAKINENRLPSNLKVCEDFTHLVNTKDNSRIYMNCLNCFAYFYGGPIPGYFLEIDGNRYFLCEFCHEIDAKKRKIIKNNPISKARSSSISYECRFNCGFCADNLANHENDCAYQPDMECPFEDCAVSDAFGEILEHLSHDHAVDICTKPFLDVELDSADQEPDTVVQKVVWVVPYFVVVTFTPGEKYWEVCVEFNDRTNVPKDIKLRASLYDGNRELQRVLGENRKYKLGYGRKIDSDFNHLYLDKIDQLNATFPKVAQAIISLAK